MEQPTPKATQEARVITVRRKSKDIHGAESMLFALMKKAVGSDGRVAQSNAAISVGTKTHLIDKAMARELRDFNATHAICLDAKQAASVGLGHRDQKIHEILDPLCKFSWQDVLDAVAADYWEGGDGFIEVVMDPLDPTRVIGLYHIDATQVEVEVEEEDNSKNYHYLVMGEDSATNLIMAKWGDLEDLKRRFNVAPTQASPATGNARQDPEAQRAHAGMQNANSAPARGTLTGTIVDSQVIHVRQSTNRSRWYGYPDYMSAVPSIELVQCMTQHEFDFYFNRGVPEFMLFLIGPSLTPECWKEITEMIQSNQGPGNSHKTAAVQIPGSAEETTVQVEKLAMEDAGNSGFSEKSDTLDMRIATAHGMPPALANIALPGKIGAANEGPNAMLTFQKRKLGQAQKNFSRAFSLTLASEGTKFLQEDGADATLSREQFLGATSKPKPNPMDPQQAMGTTDENGMPIFASPGNGFNTILDGMTLGAADTLASMREPLAGSGRNPADGTLGGADDRKPADPRRTR